MTSKIARAWILTALAGCTQLMATPQLTFEANRGQADPRVDYLVRAAGFTGWVAGGDLHLHLDPSAENLPASGLIFALEGARDVRPEAGRTLATRSNYLLGDDPDQWLRSVPHHDRVRYRGVYPGVDLVYRTAGGTVVYDFEIAPDASPETIRVRLEGAETAQIDADGRLVIQTASGRLVQEPPVAFQPRPDGGSDPVEVAFQLRGEHLSFALGSWDRSRRLVIDPPLQFSTFLGGSLTDVGNDVAVDAQGNAYVVGWTRSADFPVTPGVIQEVKTGDANRINAFLSKIDPTGSTLLYSTFLGANTDVMGTDVAVDSFGQAYVLARASAVSNLFTSSNAVQSTVGLFTHTWVAKVDSAGAAILYASFLSGSNGSTPGGVAVDAIGDIYVAGQATKLSFPMVNAYQPTVAGISDVYVVKLDPMASSSLLYATFLGGNSTDGADSLAVDAAGRVYVTGYTRSVNFPTLNAVQGYGGAYDAFAAAIDPGQSGTASLIYSTFLGGLHDDNGTVDDGGVAVDDQGYATYGITAISSGLTTTTGAYQASSAGSSDAYVVRLDPSGTLLFASYFGGSGLDQLKDVAVDASGRIALFGYTASSDLPVPGAFQASPALWSSADLFLAVLTDGATNLVQSSYLGAGGNIAEHAGGVAFDGAAVVAAGNARAGNFFAPFPITLGSLQPWNAGMDDAFLVRWPVPPANQP